MKNIVIETRGLTKVFEKKKSVLDRLDLRVEKGSVYGLAGLNGAGKTTAFRILLGNLAQTSGDALLLGKCFRNAPPRLRTRVAYVAQENELYPSMTLKELSLYLERIYPAWDPPFAGALVRRFELRDDLPVGMLSGGERRKAAILLALAARPEVILMDEPAANLDTLARRLLIEEIAGILAEFEDVTILFSTHILSDLERIADKVGILHGGNLLFESSLEELAQKVRKVQVLFNGKAIPKDFRLPGELSRHEEGSVLTGIARFDSNEERESWTRQPGLRIREFPLSLEDLFVELLQSKNPYQEPPS